MRQSIAVLWSQNQSRMKLSWFFQEWSPFSVLLCWEISWFSFVILLLLANDVTRQSHYFGQHSSNCHDQGCPLLCSIQGREIRLRSNSVSVVAKSILAHFSSPATYSKMWKDKGVHVNCLTTDTSHRAWISMKRLTCQNWNDCACASVPQGHIYPRGRLFPLFFETVLLFVRSGLILFTSIFFV